MAKRRLTKKNNTEKKNKTILTRGPLKFFDKKQIPVVSWGKTKHSYISISAPWYKTMILEIKKARRKKRISQMSLATLLGTSQAEVSRFENGKSNPTVEFLDRLISTLGMELKITSKKPKK